MSIFGILHAEARRSQRKEEGSFVESIVLKIFK